MRALGALLATLLLAAGLLLGLPVGSPLASAEEPEALVKVTLDALSPSLPQRTSEITVSGRVTNTSKKPILRPRAYFWRNQAPISDREGFDQALESASNEPLGARKIASFDNLYESADDPFLAVGATAAFQLRVKVSDLDLSPTSGIYLMGVHVLQNESSPAVGRARVFVPVLSEPPRNTVSMTSVVALNTRPSLLCSSCSPSRKGVFGDDHLAAELAAGGRLDALLTAAEQPDISFAVDPALIEEVSSMSSGYQIKGDSGAVEDGRGRADATSWLARFTRLVRDQDGYRLLYGSVDVAAATHNAQPEILAASEAAAKRVPLTAALPLLVWPGNGAADDATLAATDPLKPEAVLLSDNSTRTRAPLLKGLGAAPIVNYTGTAFQGGPGPKPSDTPVHLQQRLLAESWLQAATEPAGTTLGRVRVISTAAQAAGDDEAIKAPWVRQTTLTELLGSTPRSWSQTLHYPARIRNRELSPALLGSIDRLTESWATWRDLLADPTSASASADAAIARAASVRRRQDGPSLRAYLAPQQEDLDRRLDAVAISVTPLVVTPRSEVSFPITIRNQLPRPNDPTDTSTNAVRVRLDFDSANRQRLNVAPLPLKAIEAGENLQQRAFIDARANGTVRVNAQLRTASGLPVGPPVAIDVRATQAGTVGWFIAIGAGIVLLGTTALRIRQVAREGARKAATPTAKATGPAGPVPHVDEAEVPPVVRSAPAEDTPPAASSASIDV
ncbi:MAG TPA: hypothetical protein VEQ66_02325 [Propionibacteriaceae bacterium]|nr:hypothetical protein [Propionibacteriaceae bacterium]